MIDSCSSSSDGNCRLIPNKKLDLIVLCYFQELGRGLPIQLGISVVSARSLLVSGTISLNCLTRCCLLLLPPTLAALLRLPPAVQIYCSHIQCLISSCLQVVAICSQDEMKMLAMIGAMEATLDYGSQEDSNRIPYVRLLKSNLTIVEDFDSLVLTTQNYRRRQMLVRLMEFHTLVSVFCPRGVTSL